MNPLEVLNVSSLEQITPDVLTQTSNVLIGIPLAITLFITFAIVLLVVGLIFVKENRGNLMWILSITLIIVFVVMLILLFNPNFVMNMGEGVRGWFK